jgi:hypothetical protein
MSVHDQTASILSLARVTLSGIDARKEDTTVKSATLILLLEKLIELGSPNQTIRVSETNNHVHSLMATFNSLQERNGHQS